MDLWPCKGQNSGVHFAQSERVSQSAIYGRKTGQLHNSNIAVDITKRDLDPIPQSSALSPHKKGIALVHVKTNASAHITIVSRSSFQHLMMLNQSNETVLMEISLAL